VTGSNRAQSLSLQTLTSQLFRRGVLAAQLQWRRRRVMLHARATRIQTAYRRWQAEGVYWGLIKCMTTLQNRFRCYLAVNARKKLKTEGRDIGKLSEEKERLKQEMVALKSMLKVQQKEREKTQLLKNEEEETKMWKLKCEKLQRDLEAGEPAPRCSFYRPLSLVCSLTPLSLSQPRSPPPPSRRPCPAATPPPRRLRPLRRRTLRRISRPSRGSSPTSITSRRGGLLQNER